MQAYLGSRLLDAALQDPDFLREAMQFPRPGREFVIALVLRSRAADRADGTDRARQETSPPDSASRGSRRPRRASISDPGTATDFLAPLRAGAAVRDDNKVLDMYAAALEIDCVAAEPAHDAIASEIRARWSRIHAQDPRTLEEGKQALVRRFGEAARMIDERRRRGEPLQASPAYPQLYGIGCADRSYPVQLAAAQEIGVGGEAAYEELRHSVAAPCMTCESERVERGQRPPAESGRPASRPERTPESSRAEIISAWLAPMLVGSIGGRGSTPADKLIAEQAQADLVNGSGTSRRTGASTASRICPLRWRSRSRRDSSTPPTGVRPSPTCCASRACSWPSRRWRCSRAHVTGSRS